MQLKLAKSRVDEQVILIKRIGSEVRGYKVEEVTLDYQDLEMLHEIHPEERLQFLRNLLGAMT